MGRRCGQTRTRTRKTRYRWVGGEERRSGEEERREGENDPRDARRLVMIHDLDTTYTIQPAPLSSATRSRSGHRAAYTTHQHHAPHLSTPRRPATRVAAGGSALRTRLQRGRRAFRGLARGALRGRQTRSLNKSNKPKSKPRPRPKSKGASLRATPSRQLGSPKSLRQGSRRRQRRRGCLLISIIIYPSYPPISFVLVYRPSPLPRPIFHLVLPRPLRLRPGPSVRDLSSHLISSRSVLPMACVHLISMHFLFLSSFSDLLLLCLYEYQLRLRLCVQYGGGCGHGHGHVGTIRYGLIEADGSRARYRHRHRHIHRGAMHIIYSDLC